MAEPLPRYRKAGVLLADIPRLDFGDRREAARSSALLEERLGQLSQWALGEAADRAKDEGLQYGAENPVTVQQLKAGTAHFQPRGTIFGDAARSAQVQAITADIELESHSRINALKVGAERGTVTAIEARDEIQAMIDGTGKSMSVIDPKASAKLRASLGVAGNSALLAITQAELKRGNENRKIAVDGWIYGVVPEQVRSMIQAGDTIDPASGAVITAASRIETLRSTLNEQAVIIGDDVFARHARTEFNKVVREARVDALVKVASDPAFARKPDGTFDAVGAVMRLDKGDFGAYTKMFREMPAEEQAKVRLALRGATADRYTTERHEKEERKHADSLEVNRLVADYPTASPARRREIIAGLRERSFRSDAISGEAINSLIKSGVAGSGGGAPKANEEAEGKIMLDILAGRFSSPEQVRDAALRAGANHKQANDLVKDFDRRKDRDYQRAQGQLALAAGLTTSTFNPGRSRAQAVVSMRSELREQERLQIEAHQNDPAKHPSPNVRAITDAIIRKRQEDPLTKDIAKGLQELNDQFGPAGTTKKTGVTFTVESDPKEVRAALERAGVKGASLDFAVRTLESIRLKRRQLDGLR